MKTYNDRQRRAIMAGAMLDAHEVMGQEQRTTIAAVEMPDAEKRLRRIDMALRLAGCDLNRVAVELLTGIVDMVNAKGGGVTVDDISDLEVSLWEKYPDKTQAA